MNNIYEILLGNGHKLKSMTDEVHTMQAIPLGTEAGTGKEAGLFVFNKMVAFGG